MQAFDSSDDSGDEEEVIRNFDEEANLIVQSDSIPKKSTDRYLLVYDTYKKWQSKHKQSLSSEEENNLVVYFKELALKLKPPTLWSMYSMLKKTLYVKDHLDISKFLDLKGLIKNKNKGYKPTKSLVLTWDQIMRFMKEACDDLYLAAKVILIFGICGCLRCDEITNIKVNDVEDSNDKFLVSINDNKNNYAGQFIIGNMFYNTVKTYISLRPDNEFSDRFFIQYNKGKCIRMPIGKHKIGEVPQNIANFLNLPMPKRYTGHCFRRSSTTLLAGSGANMQMIKQLGRWRSDIIAQGYVENSMHNRELIFNNIVEGGNKTCNFSSPVLAEPSIDPQTANTYSRPSTSTDVTTIYQEKEPANTYFRPIVSKIVASTPKKDESVTFHLDESDFAGEFFDERNKNPTSNEVEETGFVTASNRKVLVPTSSSKNIINTSNNNTHFITKSPVKLNFIKQVPQAPISHQFSNKKRKIETSNTKVQDENENINATLSNRHVKFDNCTYHNCTFNITISKCIHEKEDS